MTVEIENERIAEEICPGIAGEPLFTLRAKVSHDPDARRKLAEVFEKANMLRYQRMGLKTDWHNKPREPGED